MFITFYGHARGPVYFFQDRNGRTVLTYGADQLRNILLCPVRSNHMLQGGV
jgi:hypothetical protein